jgi:cytochrome P450
VTAIEVPSPVEAPVGVPRVRDYIDIEFFDPFTNGFPPAEVDVLRNAAPVAWADETAGRRIKENPFGVVAGPGFWVVTSHAAVSQVSRTPSIFSSWLGGTVLPRGDKM